MKERKNRRFPAIPVILIPLILAFLILTLGSVSGMFLKYPYETASQWVCEDPQFSLSFTRTRQNGMIEKEVLVWNNEPIPVWIGFGKGDYTVYPRYSNLYDDRLLTGTWKYKRGNLIMVIEEDFIFDNQYSELVFHPVSGSSS